MSLETSFNTCLDTELRYSVYLDYKVDTGILEGFPTSVNKELFSQILLKVVLPFEKKLKSLML